MIHSECFSNYMEVLNAKIVKLLTAGKLLDFRFTASFTLDDLGSSKNWFASLFLLGPRNAVSS